MKLKKLIYMEAWMLRSDSFLLPQVQGIGSFSQIEQKEIPHVMVNVAQFSLTN